MTAIRFSPNSKPKKRKRKKERKKKEKRKKRKKGEKKPVSIPQLLTLTFTEYQNPDRTVNPSFPPYNQSQTPSKK
jgi:hypothetical protein